MTRKRVRAVASRVRSVYKASALMFFNIVVAYVSINLVLGGAIGIRNVIVQEPLFGKDAVTRRYGAEVLDKIYPDIDRNERELMLSEVWGPPFTFSDFNHFRTRPRDGKYVNVAETGYRTSLEQGPWPPAPENINIFAFGGSTTYGSGVPDGQTVPSFLQKAIAPHAKKRVCVYNFGVGFYYSTQERICLEKLLMDGHVPDIAVFIDGINEGDHWENRPTYSHEMGMIFEQYLSGRSRAIETTYWQEMADVTMHRLPISRAAGYVKKLVVPPTENTDTSRNWEGQKSVTRVCQTYFTNKVLIEQLCQHFGVTPIFVWQPSPAYNYDLKYHLFAPPPSAPLQQKYKFSIMSEYYPAVRDHKERAASNFLWCADIQKDRAECLYCDQYHYSGTFTKVLADYICELCIERKLFDQHLKL